MTIDLYQTPRSPNAMVVRLLAKELNINLNIIDLDLQNGENLKPEFLKLNPEHTVPTLVDDGFVIWESRAILIYLVQKYGKYTSLYPESPKVLATIHQRLFFDLGTLGARFREYFYPIIRDKLPADPEKLKKLKEAFGLLDTFLDGHNYIVGNVLTVADYSLFAGVALGVYCNIDLKDCGLNVLAWFDRVKKEIERDGIIEEHRQVIIEAFMRN